MTYHVVVITADLQAHHRLRKITRISVRQTDMPRKYIRDNQTWVVGPENRSPFNPGSDGLVCPYYWATCTITWPGISLLSSYPHSRLPILEYALSSRDRGRSHVCCRATRYTGHVISRGCGAFC